MIPTGIGASFYGMNFSTNLSYDASSNTLTAQNITCSGLISGSSGLTISSGAITLPTNSISLNSLITTGASNGQVLTSSGSGTAPSWTTLSSISSNLSVVSTTTNLDYMICLFDPTSYGNPPSTTTRIPYTNSVLRFNPYTWNLTAQSITCTSATHTGLISGSAGLTISSGTITLPVNSIALNSLPYSPLGTYYLSSVGTVNGWTNSINATQISAVAVSNLTFNITMIPSGVGASFYGMNYSTSLSYNASTNNLIAQTIT